MNSISKLQIFTVFSILLFSACSEKDNPVPYSAPNLTLYAIESDPEYRALRTIFSGVVITDDNECIGYDCNGVFLYRVQINNEIDDFVVYDRTCPYEAASCRMDWDSSEPYYLECACCGSKFNIVGGYLETGPSEYSPRKYKCDYIDGNIYIH